MNDNKEPPRRSVFNLIQQGLVHGITMLFASPVALTLEQQIGLDFHVGAAARLFLDERPQHQIPNSALAVELLIINAERALVPVRRDVPERRGSDLGSAPIETIRLDEVTYLVYLDGAWYTLTRDP